MFFKRIGYSYSPAAAAGNGSSGSDVDSDGTVGSQPQPRSPRGAIRARHAAAAANAATANGFPSSSSSSPPSYANDEESNKARPGGEKGFASSSSSSSSSSLSPSSPSSLSRSLSSLLGAGSSALLTALVCLSWMSVSSLLILLNKHLLASGFHYPMALSCLGMLFSSVASFLCCRVFNVVDAPKKNSFTVREYATKVVPIGLLMSLTLYLGNVVYLYLTVSFIQMLKAFTPVVTMAALFAAGLERPRRDLVGAVAAIAGGTALASVGEVNLSLVGVACMAASEGFEAVRLVLTQTLLAPAAPAAAAASSSSSSSSSSGENNDANEAPTSTQQGRSLGPIEGLMYLAPACSFWLLAGSSVVELPLMLREGAFDLVKERPLSFLSAAAMGFACNALAYGVIRRAGSLTLKVLGTVKNVAVVGAGMAAFGDIVTPVQGVGYAVSVAGFVSYQRVKAGGSGEVKSAKTSTSTTSSKSSSKSTTAAAEDEAKAAGLVLENKIEAVSSFLIPSNGSSSGASGREDAAAAATDAGEKRPLLPASFSASAAATTRDNNKSNFFVSSSPPPPPPLSTVDAIAAKLSEFFTFGVSTRQIPSTNELAASRV